MFTDTKALKSYPTTRFTSQTHVQSISNLDPVYRAQVIALPPDLQQAACTKFVQPGI